MSINQFKDDYAWLSNFSYSLMVWEDIAYDTVEHAFQAAKTLDRDERKVIAQLARPGDAKRAGKKVQLRDNWNGIRIPVMKELLELKFEIPELRQKLLDTGNEELVEGNYWNDFFWGVCLKQRKGQNRLGKLLMTIRSEILL
jgi:N-glycosidase YbiA